MLGFRLPLYLMKLNQAGNSLGQGNECGKDTPVLDQSSFELMNQLVALAILEKWYSNYTCDIPVLRNDRKLQIYFYVPWN